MRWVRWWVGDEVGGWLLVGGPVGRRLCGQAGLWVGRQCRWVGGV